MKYPHLAIVPSQLTYTIPALSQQEKTNTPKSSSIFPPPPPPLPANITAMMGAGSAGSGGSGSCPEPPPTTDCPICDICNGPLRPGFILCFAGTPVVANDYPQTGGPWMPAFKANGELVWVNVGG